MRQNVQNRIISFNTWFEGRIHHMYLDIKGFVTTGIGNLIAQAPDICSDLYPFTHGINGLPATCEEKKAGWNKVKSANPGKKPNDKGDSYSVLTDLRLNDAAINNLAMNKAVAYDNANRAEFTDYENFSSDAQLGLLSMRWPGHWNDFNKFRKHVKAGQWFAAAKECHFQEVDNTGIAPRNDANRWLFSLAGRVAKMNLDPTVLYYDNPGAHKLYLFKDGQYVRYDWDSDTVDADYPQPLAAWHLPDLFSSGVKAVINGLGERKVPKYFGKTYFFKGNRYVRYDWDSDQIDYISDSLDPWGLTGDFVSGIDAAVNGEGFYFGKLYFFKGNQYVRYDWVKDTIDQKPSSIAQGWDLPEPFASGIDAVVSGEGPFKGKLYFFKGSQYIRCHWGNNMTTDKYHVDGSVKNIAQEWGGLASLGFTSNLSAAVNPPGRS